MAFMRRIYIGITRNLGKSAILFLCIFTVGCVMAGAISVRQAVHNVNANIYAGLPAVVTIEDDIWAYFDALEYAEEGEEPQDGWLSHDILTEIGNLPYVAYFDFSETTCLLSSELDNYLPELDPDRIGRSGDGYEGHVRMGDFTRIEIHGMRSTNPLYIAQGIIEISQGRMFADVELENVTFVTLISENFAATNNLGVGSTITLEDIRFDHDGLYESRGAEMIDGFMQFPDGYFPEDLYDGFYIEENIVEHRFYDFEVVGIYALQNRFEGATVMDTIDSNLLNVPLENRIYIPNTTVRELIGWGAEAEAMADPFWGDSPGAFPVWGQNIYVLYDARDIPAFRAAAEEILPPFHVVISAGSNWDNVGVATETLNDLADMIIVVTAIATVLILTLLITLLIRERRREIGIYLALGEKKRSVITQVVAEMAVIALIAITASLFVGNLLARDISEDMLQADFITAQAAPPEWTSFGNMLDLMGHNTTISLTEVLAAYDASLDATTVAVFYIATITTILIAAIVPILYLMRLNPRKIMM